ncbi:MAG: ester cyclase [Candidatus Hodarchaeales archaeon]|jgi:hypothetical protein
MSDYIEKAQHLLQAIEEANVEKAATFLSENFVFEGPVPQPLNKEQFTGFLHAMSKAFAEFKYNSSNFSEEGDTVTYSLSITGKHTGELVLPNMDSIPATNKTFELPTEKSTITFSGDKISKMYAKVSEDGGVGGIIKQITS